MMTQELLKKLKAKDLSAYNEIYDQYGWELHNYLKKTYPNETVSSEVFAQTMEAFCRDLTKYGTTDVMEAALFMYADRTMQTLTAQSTEETTWPETPAAPEGWTQQPNLPEAAPSQKKKGGFGRFLLTVLLLLVAAAALWVIFGQVLRMGLLPNFSLDLGYNWFNQNIAWWF